MEMKITISEDNTEEIARLATEAGKAALETCALIAEAYAIKLCPVDTGRLRGSITHGVDMGELCAYIGTNVEYAPYQELGTSRGVPARHFIQYGASSHWNDGLKTQLENILKNG